MKLNPYILLFIVILGVGIGLSINGKLPNIATMISSVKDEYNNIVNPVDPSTTEATPVTSTLEGSTTNITPEYVMDFLEKNDFSIKPVYHGKTTDIYGAELDVPNTLITVSVDVYEERSTKKVLLIESNIDTFRYTNYNVKQLENLVNQVANHYFVAFAKIPYYGSKPSVAGQWVKKNILTSYDEQPKDKTRTKIGPAQINIFGDPLFRTLEIDFGFVREN